MEDIIAYSIIAIIPVVVIFGAVLLRRYFVRRKERKIKLQQESAARKHQYLEQQRREKQKEKEAIAELYNKGLVGRQEYDFHTQTIKTSVHDPKTNTTKYVTTSAAQNVAPGTVLPQTAGNFGTDLLTIMGLAGLASSIGSTPAHSKSTDFGFDDSDSQKSAYKSFSSSDSSSSWSDSSDSGPSSDW